MNQWPLLEILADGRFHSGDELGRALGVSRAAIWKAVQGLQALNLDVHSVKGKGHRLAAPLELLRREAILAELDAAGKAALQDLEILLNVDSTNSHLMRQAQEAGSAPGLVRVCLAEQQSAGRGRRGRRWVSPFGRNMYLSLLRQFATGAVGLEGLSLVVAVALVRALRQAGVEGLALKWPNDVLWGRRKLAGILLEMSGDVTGDCQVVIGIGLNIDSDPRAMAEVEQPWIDLRAVSPVLPGRNRLVGLVLMQLLAALREFETGGFAVFRAEWEALDAYRGLPVEVRQGAAGEGGSTSGVAQGVDAHGALRLDTGNGVRIFSGGEVSIRAEALGKGG